MFLIFIFFLKHDSSITTRNQKLEEGEKNDLALLYCSAFVILSCLVTAWSAAVEMK